MPRSKRQPITRAVLRAVKNPRIRASVEEALRLGWRGTLLGSGHLRLLPPPGTGGEPMIVSTTDTDSHGVRNGESPLRRWKRHQ